MSERIELQPEGDDISRTEQDDTTDDPQGTSPNTEVTFSRWRKISFTVVTLLAYLFLNAGVSLVAPFYAILWSVPMYNHPGRGS